MLLIGKDKTYAVNPRKVMLAVPMDEDNVPSILVEFDTAGGYSLHVPFENTEQRDATLNNISIAMDGGNTMHTSGYVWTGSNVWPDYTYTSTPNTWNTEAVGGSTTVNTDAHNAIQAWNTMNRAEEWRALTERMSRREEEEDESSSSEGSE